AGERVVADQNGCCVVGDIVEQPGTKHTSLRVFRDADPDPQSSEQLTVLTAGKYRQRSYPRFAARPAEAPIVHLNGPVTLRLDTPRQWIHEEGVGAAGGLGRGRDAGLYGPLGAPGVRKRAF